MNHHDTKAKWSKKALTWLFFASVIIVGFFGFCIWSIFATPTMQLTGPSKIIDPLLFRLNSQGINGVMSVRFSSATKRDPLWEFEMWTWPLNEFKYGDLPAINRPEIAQPVKQTFPIWDTQPRKLQEGEKFVVQVNYQYDRFFSACAGTKSFAFEILPGGSIKNLGEIGNN